LGQAFSTPSTNLVLYFGLKLGLSKTIQTTTYKLTLNTEEEEEEEEKNTIQI
jgi:hypothetical protein